MEKKNQINLAMDGKEIVCEPGKTILTVARDNNIEIPTLCYDPRLEPYGSCLLCVVEVEGIDKLLLSCTTEVRDGMIIKTNNEKIYKARKNALELLLSNHFADCRGPCYEKCPADVNPQGYLALANAGKYKEALELIRETNPFPLVCGRICVRYCEAACRRKDVDSPVGINFVKRYVADLESDHLERPTIPQHNGHKVAIVGGGPGGLSCAYFLAKRGYKIKIFDAHPKLGGMLRYGIPDYRLPQNMLDKEIQYIVDHGIDVQTNARLGKDFSLDDLKKEGFDSIFVALGAQKAKKMGIEKEENEGVIGGVDFLEKVKKQGPPELKGHVVVVGGGNTAIDAARTALRCKASKVSILYRRTRHEMPADEVEIEDALAEGVEIEFLVAPLGVIAENGRVKSLRCQKMELGEPDASGRRRPVPVEGSEYDVICNTIIAAIGQDSDLTGIKGNALGDLKATKWDTIVADEKTFATTIKGVFAGGDVVSGPAAAIDAIGAGRKAAMVIDRYIQTGEILPAASEFLSSKTNLGEIPKSYFESFAKIDRSSMQQVDAEIRVNNFDEGDKGIAPGAVHTETSRCLFCGCSDLFTCELKKFAGEYDVNQKRYGGTVKKLKVDDRHPYILLDPNKCILCGKCVRTCDMLLGLSALGYINRGYDMVVRPSMEKPLQDTTCIACGNCIETCPTGAISFNHPFERPWPQNPLQLESVCNYCGIGCNIVYNKKDDDFWNVTAKKESRYINGELCMRGRFGHRHIIKENRLYEPKVRDGNKLKATNLEYAIKHAASGLKAVYEKYGPDALGFFVSPKATNEEIFMVQKLARDVFNSNNIASLYDLTCTDDNGDLYAAFGVTASTLPFRHVKDADVIVMLNSNVTEDNPVLSFDIKRAARKGAELISISSMELEINNFATLWLDTRRGTNTMLLNAAISEIIKHERFDAAEVNKRADNFSEFKNQPSISLSRAAEITGVDKYKIQRFADIVSDPDKNVVFVYNGGSLLEKSPGDLQAIANLLLLTGKIGKDNNGLILTHEHSNYQGHRDLCATPSAARENNKLSRKSTLRGARSFPELRDLMLNGTIKGFLIFGEDFAINTEYAALLTQAEHVVVVDMFQTETTNFAHTTIPGSAYAESEGSVTSQDRRVQAFTRVFDPPAGKTGVEILSALYAQASGKPALTIETIRSEIAELNPLYKKITEIGERGSFCWNETATGGALLFSTGFLTENRKANFIVGAQSQKPMRREVLCFSPIDKIYQINRYQLLSSTKGDNQNATAVL